MIYRSAYIKRAPAPRRRRATVARVVFRVIWHAATARWRVTSKQARTPAMWLGSFNLRRDAVEAARRTARDVWSTDKVPAQLVVHHKGGNTIAFENTYGRDPKRYAG